MTSNAMPREWRRNVIRFDRWHNDAFGTYEFTARNQRHFFRFGIEPAGSTIRIVILEHPEYGHRPAGFRRTGRYCADDGQICVAVRPDHRPRTVPEALGLAVYWAEQTSEYIEKGQPLK